MLDPLCHRLLPLRRDTFSEIGRHAEFITVRVYQVDAIDTIGSRAKERGLRGEHFGRVTLMYAVFVAVSRSFAPV